MGVSYRWAALLALCVTGAAWGQTEGKYVWEEFGDRVTASAKVNALGPDLFGDQVSLSNGALMRLKPGPQF